MHTVTRVAKHTYRINHPQTNAQLTRSKGVPSAQLYTRLWAVIVPSQDFEHTVRALSADSKPKGLVYDWYHDWTSYDLVFKKGVNTKRWYFKIVKGA
jgi:hypothetical protein